ncbi:hypothetical protein LBMAG53_04660 [Planctomycetota bacterium]|nr:hypothetical protein LBMAG53_04660 [Planctomycetota bacterium]
MLPYRIALVTSPGLAGLLAAFLAGSPGMAIGGAIALALLIPSAALVALTERGSLVLSAGAAMASFLIRFGGAGMVAWLVNGRADSTELLATLAGALGVSLIIDLTLWSTIATRPVLEPAHG